VKRGLRYGVLVGVLALTSRAGAFCRTTTCNVATTDCRPDENGCATVGKPLVWGRPMPLAFRFHARGTALLVNEEARAAVRDAFFRWTDVVCPTGRTSLRFIEGEELDVDKPLSPDGEAKESLSPFGIYFRDGGWPHPQRNGDGALALTTLSAGADSGRITYADIEINSGERPLSTTESGAGIDLQTIVIHEVGHYIGLAHSRVPNAIMNAGLCETGDRCTRDKVAARRLGDDDRAAVCALYPPGAPPPSSEDSGGCSFARAGAGGAWCPYALAALVWRARRRLDRRNTNRHDRWR
jgi:hypothetical protein